MHITNPGGPTRLERKRVWHQNRSFLPCVSQLLFFFFFYTLQLNAKSLFHVYCFGYRVWSVQLPFWNRLASFWLNSSQFSFMASRLVRFTIKCFVCVRENISQVLSAAGLRETWSHSVDNSTVVVPFLLSIIYPTHTNTHTAALQSAHHPCQFIIT